MLAAAIKSGAQVIVTGNVRDFPTDVLTQWNIEAKSPDEFTLDQIGIDERTIWAIVGDIAESRSNPPNSVDDVLRQLESSGLIRAILRQPPP